MARVSSPLPNDPSERQCVQHHIGGGLVEEPSGKTALTCYILRDKRFVMSAVASDFGGRVRSAEEFPELSVLLGRIRDAAPLVDVVLYGSRARGEATAQSDWDLKVIVSDDAPEHLFTAMFGWDIQEGSGVYADVSFIRLSDFKQDLSVSTSASSYMVEDGVVIDVS